MGITVIGAVFVDIKGFPEGNYIPTGRNVGRVEYVHGGVSRNVVEDIANMELRPTFLSIVDDSALGHDVKNKLEKHKVNTKYMLSQPQGMGTWLVVFNHDGDVAGSISQRPNLLPLLDVLNEKGDEIISESDSVVLEVDIDRPIVKKVLELCAKYNKPVFGLVSNMSIAVERRDLLQQFTCFICNQLEAGQLFLDDYSEYTPEQMEAKLKTHVASGNIPSMIVTMGGKGAVFATKEGKSGYCPARKVFVKDTTGAGDSFCAGVSATMTYGKSIEEAMEIGSFLAASVITSMENVCPRFLPSELGLSVPNLD